METPIEYRERLKTELNKYLELEDNWDCYGGIPPHNDIIAMVISFIDTIDIALSYAITDFFPNPHGTITIEWENEYGLTHCEIGLRNFTYFIKFNDGKQPIINNVKTTILEDQNINTDLTNFINNSWEDL